MMRILRVVVIISTTVVMTACATSSKQPEPQIRVIGVDGEELEQVVPMGVPAPAPDGQVKPTPRKENER